MPDYSQFTQEQLTAFGAPYLPGHLGIEILSVANREVHARLEVQKHHLAPNGYLHAGTVVSLADTAAGYACLANLPEGGESFTTIELKSNHLGTARTGLIEAHARMAHGGRTTQVWDVTVSHAGTGKTIALFRCTQMILYPKA